MRLIPSRTQWRSWSLPSKLTAFGTLLGALSLVFYLVEKALTVPDFVAQWLAAHSSASYRDGEAEYLVLDDSSAKARELSPIPRASDEMKAALAAAIEALDERPLDSLALHKSGSYFAISESEEQSDCKVLLGRLRSGAGLKPKQGQVDHNRGCDARFEVLAVGQEPAILTWSWGGNGLMLDLGIYRWHQSEFVAVPVDWGRWGEAQFAFADLDGDGVKELIIAKANRWENPPELAIFQLSRSGDAEYHHIPERDPRFQAMHPQVPDIADQRLWEWVHPEDVGIDAPGSPTK